MKLRLVTDPNVLPTDSAEPEPVPFSVTSMPQTVLLAVTTGDIEIKISPDGGTAELLEDGSNA